MSLLNIVESDGKRLSRAPRAVIYARVEADRELLGKVYLLAERIKLQRLTHKIGIEVVTCYGEVDRGNKNDTELRAAIRQLEKKEAEILVVFDMTRLARSSLSFVSICDRIRAADAVICTARDLHDPDPECEPLAFVPKGQPP